jgi:hypothetical protein
MYFDSFTLLFASDCEVQQGYGYYSMFVVVSTLSLSSYVLNERRVTQQLVQLLVPHVLVIYASHDGVG